MKEVNTERRRYLDCIRALNRNRSSKQYKDLRVKNVAILLCEVYCMLKMLGGKIASELFTYAGKADEHDKY